MTPYTPILGVLVYITSGDQVLMIHRQGRPDDLHLGKYNGLGGKVEPDEDIVRAVMREVREEAGVDLVQPRLRGTISWPGFGSDGEDWFGFVFTADTWTGEVGTSNDEGVLEWVPLSRLLAFDLPLWPGDRHFLPLVFDPLVSQFHGVMPYDGGTPVSWTVTIVPTQGSPGMNLSRTKYPDL